MLHPLIVTENPDREDVALIEARIDAFNMARSGIDDARLLTIVVRNDGDEIIAGLHGWTWGNCCEVKLLWVDELHRGHGLGHQLMETAEQEARARGATQMVLSTHSFQAPAFYRKLGFIEVGRVYDYPVGHSSIYLRKVLNPLR